MERFMKVMMIPACFDPLPMFACSMFLVEMLVEEGQPRLNEKEVRRSGKAMK